MCRHWRARAERSSQEGARRHTEESVGVDGAHIHAEFEFQGSETYSADASLGAMVEVVNVKAGYSALYSSTSKNKITVDVDFALAHYDI